MLKVLSHGWSLAPMPPSSITLQEVRKYTNGLLVLVTADIIPDSTDRASGVQDTANIHATPRLQASVNLGVARSSKVLALLEFEKLAVVPSWISGSSASEETATRCRLRKWHRRQTRLSILELLHLQRNMDRIIITTQSDC